MSREADDGNSASPLPHCEIEKTLPVGGEGECHKPGEVLYSGALLCRSHAALLELEERAEAALKGVFRVDELLDGNGSPSADEEFVGRLQRERDEAVAALRLMRAQIRIARKALSGGR